MNEENNNGISSSEEQRVAQDELFPLDDAGIAMLEEITAQERQLQSAAEKLSSMRQGVLTYFLRQHKLQGNWRLAENQRELVKSAQE